MKQKFLDNGNPDLYSSKEYPHCSSLGLKGEPLAGSGRGLEASGFGGITEGICDLFAQGEMIPREEVKRWGPGLGSDAF